MPNASWKFVSCPLAVLLAILLAGCSSEKTPESYGLFLIQDGKFIEVQKGAGKIEIETGSQPTFVLFDKNVADQFKLAQLRSLIYIRNNVYRDQNGRLLRTESRNQWDRATGLAFELVVKPAKHPEMVYLVPRSALPAGVYEFTFQENLNSRGWVSRAFFVDRKNVLEAAKSNLCNDYEAYESFIGFVKKGTGLVSCAVLDGARKNGPSTAGGAQDDAQTVRAGMLEVILAMSACRTTVIEQYEAGGKPPGPNNWGCETVTSKYVKTLSTDANGQISATVKGIGPQVDDKVVTLVPTVNNVPASVSRDFGKGVNGFVCGGKGTSVDQNYLPTSCRGQ